MKYLNNTSWLFAEKILRMTVGLFVGAWVARYLGTEQFGLLNYVLSFVGLFAVIGTLGLDNIVIRELVKNEINPDLLLGTAFWLKLTGAFVVIGILAIAINFTSNDTYINTFVFIIGSTTIFQSFNVIDFYFQSKVLSRYVVYANIFSFSVSSVLKIFLILLKAPLIAFISVILLDSFVLSCGFVYYYNKNNLSLKYWKPSKITAMNLLKDSWPLIISGVVIAVYMKIDQIMIKEIIGNEAVGQYAAAVKLSEIWYFIPMVISASLFPAIINAKKQGEKFYNLRLQKLYDLMAYLAIGIAIPVFFISDWVVNLLYGNQYFMSGSILKIHIWAGIFVFLGVASAKWLVNENLQKYAMINTLIGALVNIVLNYILIHKTGVIGAAWSTLIAYFLASYFCLILFKKTRPNFYSLSKSLMLTRILYGKKTN